MADLDPKLCRELAGWLVRMSEATAAGDIPATRNALRSSAAQLTAAADLAEQFVRPSRVGNVSAVDRAILLRLRANEERVKEDIGHLDCGICKRADEAIALLDRLLSDPPACDLATEIGAARSTWCADTTADEMRADVDRVLAGGVGAADALAGGKGP